VGGRQYFICLRTHCTVSAACLGRELPYKVADIRQRNDGGGTKTGTLNESDQQTCSFLIDCNFIFPSQTSMFASILPPITQSLDSKLLSLSALRLSNSIHQRIIREANLFFLNQQT
jgi:hypothetical protein